MRTTLDIDEDVLLAAKEIADMSGSTAGKVLSTLARAGLSAGAPDAARTRNGVPVLPRRPASAAKPTMTLVNRLRD